MNIQYCHVRNMEVYLPEGGYTFDGRVTPRGGETIALEVPEPWMLEVLVVGDFFTKQVGKARCSTDDNYNKKAGRDLATARMKPTVLTVISVSNHGELKTVVVEDPSGNKYLLDKQPNFTKVHFTTYE